MPRNTKEIPIILTAFGTTAKAFATYKKMDKIFKQNFPEHQFFWTYSSRMVKHAMEKNQKLNLKDPFEMAQTLAASNHKWIVMQSLHLICGHEFDRLAAQQDNVNIRSSMGLPLLTSIKDYEKTITALAPSFPQEKDHAVILIGHGTDHPAWTAYPALESFAQKQYSKRIFVGVLEGFPDMDNILERVKSAGFTKVCMIPLLLVAGFHFKKDLTIGDNSWQKTFERNNIKVSIVDHGIGEIEAVTKIFCDHIADALDVIPL